MWRVFSIISIILLGFSSFYGFKISQKRTELKTDKWQKEILFTDKEITGRKKSLADLHGELKKTFYENAQWSGRLQELKTKTEESQAVVTALEDEVQKKDDELRNLRQEMESDLGDIEQVKAELFRIESEVDSLTAQRAAKKIDLTKTEQRIKTQQQSLASYRNIRENQSSGEVSPNFSARVKSVYPEWGFVILNKGVYAGISPRARLSVYQGDEAVAELAVRTVESNRAIADIQKGSLASGKGIYPGDLVKASANFVAQKEKLDRMLKNSADNSQTQAPASDKVTIQTNEPTSETSNEDTSGDLETNDSGAIQTAEESLSATEPGEF